MLLAISIIAGSLVVVVGGVMWLGRFLDGFEADIKEPIDPI
jgi:hypothetical protein